MGDTLPGGAPAFEQPDFSKFGPEVGSDTELTAPSEVEADLGDDGPEDDIGRFRAAGEDVAGVPELAEDSEIDGNASEGGRAALVLEHLASSIVDDKDSVVVETTQSRGQMRLYLHVAQSDMGRVIGRRGRTAQAVRTLVRAAAASEGRDAFVEIVD
ncbi:MAG: KH domain-containing protein [Acidimicrobiales bacterium]